MKNLFLLLILIFAVKMINAQDLTGRVVDNEGNPIEEAFIYGAGKATTDSSGLFKIKSIESNFLLILSDFKPSFIKLDGEKTVEVKLNLEKKENKLVLSKCSNTRYSNKIKGKSVGISLITSVPKISKITKSKDIDYIHYSVSNTLNEKKQWLEIWWGGNATSGLPNREWLEKSDEVNVRSINNQSKDIGFDYSGKTNDGNYWRYIQIRLQSNFYIVDSENTKKYFDNLLDSSCVTIE